MCDRSNKIAKDKMERDITSIILQIDTKNTKKLTYDMIGKILYIMGVFKVSYNGKYDELPSNDCNKMYYLKTQKEKVFHEKLWRILRARQNEYVTTEKLKDALLILYESYHVPISILAENLTCNL